MELLFYGGSENDRLYYWNRLNKSSSAEVDFIIVRNGEIFSVEVKSGSPSRLKSLSLFLKEHQHCKLGFVLYSGNIKKDLTYRLKYMPLYTKMM